MLITKEVDLNPTLAHTHTGLPFLIVLISAAVLQENYIAPKKFGNGL